MAVTCDFNLQDPNEIYLGDNIDMANCLKSEIEKAQKEHDDLKSVYQERMVTGNHSRTLPIGEYYIVNGEFGRVFCTHGDREANEEYWKAYRSKPKGAGFLKRTFWVPALEIFEDIYDRSIHTEIFDRMASVAKSNNCTAYICGHFHPKEVIDVMHNDVRILVLPRGRTELDL
eukprot:CAMPEP_0168556808 /NCGR_PEP_ID=MMETSP0413-20121227/9082_1 /TAXON_ID=136452 /ORGANISM="Filamoeba nolandi, Strain NC-AS-23-1" /LENGTH=172 /DNA_ID=CAMNT_0008587783 /DNA_START=44 /DNA_END=562 /DNA_ORIENTATION=-